MPSLRSLSPPFGRRTAALAWVLHAAFGSPATGAESVDETKKEEPDARVALARRLGLSPRIVARASRERLARSLGEAATRELTRDHHRAVAVDLERETLLAELGAAAREVGRPCAWLKAGALHVSGRLLPGSRPSSDLDVLVRAADGPCFLEALSRRGFSPLGAAYAHQWPAMRSPRGTMTVELHRSIPGLRLPREAARESAHDSEGAANASRQLFVRFEDLERARVLLPSPASPDAVEGAPTYVPAREILVAHAAVHTWRQHLWSPAAYAQLVSLADLVDLGMGGPEAGDLEAGAARWTRADFDPEWWRALADLAAALSRLTGGSASLDLDLPPLSGPGRLLDHAVAGALDPDYARSLELHWLTPVLVEGPRSRAFLAAVGAAFSGTSPWRWPRRVADLGGRLWRAAISRRRTGR